MYLIVVIISEFIIYNCENARHDKLLFFLFNSELTSFDVGWDVIMPPRLGNQYFRWLPTGLSEAKVPAAGSRKSFRSRYIIYLLPSTLCPFSIFFAATKPATVVPSIIPPDNDASPCFSTKLHCATH